MTGKQVCWFALIPMLVFSACSTQRTVTTSRQVSAMGNAVDRAAASPTPAPIMPTDGELTLGQALALAFERSASLATAVLEVGAAEARVVQAGLYPNPELAIDFENLAGSGPFSGIDGTESTITLSQPILLGGKRHKQIEKAALQSEIAAWEVQRKRFDLYAEVHNAFNRLLIAQEDIAVKSELLALSERLLETTSLRIRAGKVSSAEASRVEVILAQNRIALERAKRLLALARRQLASAWGGESAYFTTAVGEYEVLFTLPPEDSLQQLLAQNPDLTRFETELRQRQVAIALEDARAIPDPTLSGGVRHINATGDFAFVMGVSIPLPLSNRNQGSREEARHGLAKTEKEKQAVRVKLRSELSEAYNLYQAIHTEVSVLKEQILPQAGNAYQRINEGYLQGRFDFLDVLDAQRTLFESKDRYLHALREFHETVVRIERLIAQRIH